MKKLIIWDFDGVIADTEKLWVASRMKLLNSYYNLNWDFDTTNKHIGDMQKMAQGFALTPDIEDIFKIKDFEQCIATGGTLKKTEMKIKTVGIQNYFPLEKVFTSDLVTKGKPEPDLFLLAAQTMGYNPENCFVIEDSIAGITAAQKAKMNVIAFVKYNSEDYIKEIEKLGIKHIFYNMKDVKNFLLYF